MIELTPCTDEYMNAHGMGHTNTLPEGLEAQMKEIAKGVALLTAMYAQMCATAYHQLQKRDARATMAALNLDSGIPQTQDDAPCTEGVTDMGSRIKRRLKVDGVEKWVSGNSEQEVMEAAARLLNHVDAPAPKEVHRTSAPLFQSYAEEWKRLYRDDKRKHTTLSEYQSILQKHLYPAFGEKRVDEIKTADIQSYINGMEKAPGKPYSKKTVHEVVMVLGMVLDSAKEDGFIQTNPARSKRLVNPSRERKQRTPLTEEQVKDIVEHLPDLTNATDRRFVALLMFTGMRRNEVLGLKWSDLDWNTMTIHVRRGVTFKGNHPVIDTPKTEAGVRDVPLLPQLAPFLEQREDGAFIVGDGENPITESFMKRMWQRIERTVNVYGKTPHCFRHTFATTMWRAGVDENVMQKIGGWADKRTMQGIYTHVQQTDVDKARQTIALAFGGGNVTADVNHTTAS